MQIRLATTEDLPGIVAIYNESIPGRMATADLEPVTVEQRRPWFANFGPGKKPLWVAEGKGQIAGWLSLGPYKERAGYRHTAEVGIYLSTAHFGTGLSRQLIEHALQEAPQWDIKTILAIIFGHNTRSIRFFEHYGFTKWGHLPAVTEMEGIERDVVIYGLRINP